MQGSRHGDVSQLEREGPGCPGIRRLLGAALRLHGAEHVRGEDTALSRGSSCPLIPRDTCVLSSTLVALSPSNGWYSSLLGQLPSALLSLYSCSHSLVWILNRFVTSTTPPKANQMRMITTTTCTVVKIPFTAPQLFHSAVSFYPRTFQLYVVWWNVGRNGTEQMEERAHYFSVMGYTAHLASRVLNSTVTSSSTIECSGRRCNRVVGFRLTLLCSAIPSHPIPSHPIPSL